MESSSKRAKAPVNNITQVVAHCLADGCTADLSLCRDYHRRHKVCQIHSKTPKVTIAGREQRFCQQCSRFHSLVEFDEGKRSCRKRLDGHNRRRRKPPQPDKNSRLVFSPPPTGSILSFSSATPILSSSSWSAEPDMMLYDHPPTNYNQNQLQFQFQFIHDADANANSDPDRALSLLSPAPQESVHNYGALGLGHHYPFEDHQETNPPLVSHIPAGMMFQSAAAASDGSSSTAAAGSHQTLTFMWE